MDHQGSIFTQLPIEVLLDLLLLTDAKAISRFYAVNSTHKNLFNCQRGLWQLLSCKIYHWSAADVKLLDQSQKDTSDHQADTDRQTVKDDQVDIDWHKEFRVASHFDSLIRNAELTHNDYKPKPPLLQTIAKNHFKVDGCVANDFGVDYTYCTLQSVEPLYPLPIGNFTVAYYEVEVLKLGLFDFVVGAAQDGYCGYVGLGRCSYSHASDASSGIFYLGSEFVSEESQTNPLYFLHPGDIVGFGIDYHNKSIFWTKNGELVFESKEDAQHNPILNINSLHATVSMDNHEFTANFGTTPFAFNVLGYQKKHSPASKLVLYSEKILPHLVSFMDSDSFKGKYFPDHSAFYPLASDFNPPKFDADISPFLYMLTYCRNDPNFISVNFADDIFIQLQTCRAVCGARQRLLELKEPLPRSTTKFFQSLAEMFGQQQQSFEEKPWQEKVTLIEHLSANHVTNVMGELIFRTLDSTAQYAFSRDVPDWALTAVTYYEIMYVNRPDGHYVKQAAIELLANDIGEEQPTVAALVDFALASLLRNRSAAMQTVANQRCKEIARKKAKDQETLAPVFMDLDFLANYIPMHEELQQRADLTIPRTELEKKLEPVYLFHMYNNRYYETGPASKLYMNYFIMCGAYKFKIDPEPFPTKEEYLNEVERQIRVLLSYDLLQEFLQYCKQQSKDNLDEKSFRLVTQPLYSFGLPAEALSWSIEKLRTVIRSIKTIEYGVNPNEAEPGTSDQVATKTTTKPANNVGLGVGIIAGLAAIGVGLGFYFFRKRLAK